MARMTTITRVNLFTGTPQSRLYDCQMKRLKTSVRAATKLGIAKDKLKALSHDKLEQVSGGDAPADTHKADRAADYY